MLSLLPRTRLRTIAAVCGAVILTAGLAACGSSSSSGGSSSSAAASAGLRIGYAGAAPAGFDPHDGTNGSFQSFFPAYDTLLHVDSKGDLQPWLATAWTYVDPTTLQFTLRSDVKFTDGTAFDAAAVKANVEHARDLETGTTYRTYLQAVTDVKVVDATTVQLILSAPNPDLPFDFSQNAGEMVSPKALADPATLVAAPAGSGPYIVDTAGTRQGTTLAWKRNPDYWAASQNVYQYDTITYTFGQDPTAIRNLAQAGSIDLLNLQPGDATPPGFETVNSTSGDNAGLTGIWLDSSGTTQPALKDVKVRQAINYAIDTATIADTVYEGAATPVPAVPVLEGTPAYSDALKGRYSFDPAKAKSLLAEAGYADGFSMKLLALPVAESFAQAIAGNLRDVGITAEITSVTGPDLPKQLFTGTYSAGLLLQRATGQAGQDLPALFSADAFYNVHKSSDPALQDELSAAAAMTDAGARTAAYQKAAVTAADDAWFAGTMMLQNISAFKTGVVKVTPPPFGEIFPYHYSK